MIQTTHLDHKGGLYIYRTHTPKLLSLCDTYQTLQLFLNNMHKECPNQYFQGGGPRSSTLKLKLDNRNEEEHYEHEVSLLAGHGLKINYDRFKDNHSRVQVFMLEHDKKTIAMEIPLWMHAHELEQYNELFDTEKELSGHIDILRIEDGNVWVWDYKPNAAKEKYASTQVYFYAWMLSKRTGIPFEHMRCGYFDHTVAYTFNPNTARIPGIRKLTAFVSEPL